MTDAPGSDSLDLDGSPDRPRPERRSFYALGAVALGYAVAREAPVVPSAALFAAACALLAIAALGRGRACKTAFLLGVAVLAAAWFTLRVHERPADSLGRLLPADPIAEPAVVTVTGMVRGDPRDLPPPRGALARFAHTEPASEFELLTRSVDTPAGPLAVSGRMRVRVDGRAAALPAQVRAGATVRVTGHLRPVRGLTNPGEADTRALANQDGRVGTLGVEDPSLIAPAEATSWTDVPRGRILSALAALRRRAGRALDAAAGAPGDQTDDPRPRALLAALLLGERDPALDEVNAAFARLGLVHLVAISGFNMAALAFAVVVLVRLTGDRGAFEPLAVAAVVALYLLVLPAEAPVLRAGLTLLAFLAAEAAGRRYDRVTLLGWVAVLLLVLRPLDLWSLGFQLSFGIVALLLLLGDRTRDRLFGVPIRGLVRPRGTGAAARRWLVGLLRANVSASVLAWAVATPLVLHHTGTLSPLAPLATLVVLPIATCVLAVGYAALLLGTVLPAAAGLVGVALGGLAWLLVRVVLLIDEAPGTALRLPQVSGAWALAATALVLWWFARGRPRDRRLWLITVAVLAWLAVEIGLAGRPPHGARLRIDTLAVGDGTCHLVRSGRDALLWDCGSIQLVSGLGDRTVARAVRAVGGVRVPTALVTHANFDHYSGLLDAAEPLGIRRVLLTRAFLDAAAAQPDGAPAAFVEGLRARGVEVRVVAAGDTIGLGEATLRFLSPPGDAALRPVTANDSSLVASIEVSTPRGPRRAILTGDIGPGAIARLLPEPEDPDALRADILELPHHGSVNEPARRLLLDADPRVVLQSTGPTRARDGRWEPFKAGRDWWVTARHGAVWSEVGRDGEVRSGRATAE